MSALVETVEAICPFAGLCDRQQGGCPNIRSACGRLGLGPRNSLQLSPHRRGDFGEPRRRVAKHACQTSQ